MTGIRGGRIIDPVSGKDFIGDLILENGTIKAVGEQLNLDGCEDIIEAAGMAVAPGLVDVHVHFRDPGFTAKEDINTGAAAAAKGGVTTVVLMANTKPAVDSEETLHYILDKGAKTGIHVTTCANVTMGMQGKQLTDMKKLAVAGAVGFTDDGVPLLDAELVRRAMDMGFYEGVNLSLAYCDDCGHQELEMDVCPKCGSRNLTKIDRMNGYLAYSRVHGDTRLSDAKMAEIAERKSM